MTFESPASIATTLQHANALLQAGRWADAASVLRAVQDGNPAHPEVAAAVARAAATARTWLTLGQATQATALLAPLAASPRASGELLMLDAHALMATGRKDEAEAVLRRWVALEPGNRDATLRLAAVLADQGKPAEAEAMTRAEIARGGPSTDAAFVLGRSLLGQARFEEAETRFRAVVRERPEHQIAQANLMELVWMRTGDADAACRAIDAALRAQPELHGLRITKARLLDSVRRPREALAELEAGLARAGDSSALLASAASVALQCDGDRAIAYARRLIAVVPHDRQARVAFGNASLATGDARAALEMAKALHRDDPTDGQALAMQADALRMLGDPAYRGLLDYRHFVRAACIDVPPGWTSLDAYLGDLVAALGHLHTLRAHPIGNSLRQGSQIPLAPQVSKFAAIRAFPVAIDGPIRAYTKALGAGDDPMRRRNTGRYRLSGMWSVRLQPRGFHVNHYHPEGWISSACYLHLPAAVTRAGGEGWLKFGEPAFPTRPALAPEYFIKPEPGLLALFPSYMWHGTVPFSGAPGETRLTIAFDVVPA